MLALPVLVTRKRITAGWVRDLICGVPVAERALAYIIGYLANLIPIPGGIGVLEGGLAGMLILYGAPATSAAAAVLVYHAIAFWIPSLGGVGAYWRLRCRLRDLSLGATPASPPQDVVPEFAKPCGLRRSAQRAVAGRSRMPDHD